MQSVDVNAFFSCSFDKKDHEVNEFIRSICAGLDIKLTNVSTGSNHLPLDKAKKIIEASEGLIAVCVAREELANGTFNMPQSVNDEIAFAYGVDKPILAFIEKGVNKGGFKEKFRTYHEFDRNLIKTDEEISKFIRAVHEFKVEIIEEGDGAHYKDASDTYTEDLSHLVELRKEGNDYLWEYTTTKKIIYKRQSTRAFPTSVFSTSATKVPENAVPIEWKFEQLDSSRGLKLIATIDEQSPTQVDVRLQPDRAAEVGDFVKYRTFTKSRYLLPLWEDESEDEKKIYLESGDFKVYDGLLFLNRTKHAKIEFRIAREYGLKMSDIVPFVASYTSSVDFEVPEELERTKVTVDDFGGAITIRMDIDSALPKHVYAIAWNPLVRPTG